MKRSLIIAALLAIGVTGWIASGQLADGGSTPASRKPPAALDAGAQMPSVRVRRQKAEIRTAQIVLRGRTEAERMVEVRAETHGRITALPAEEGAGVSSGQVIARLAPEERPAMLQEAKALREQRRVEYEAARRLAKKGFRAETQLAGSKAALEASEAAVTRAQVELENIKIAAPFDGRLDLRMAEIGDYVKEGDRIARVIDLDPILVVGQVSERDIGMLKAGGVGRARLITGREVEGQIRFIGAVADPVTRTFRVELDVANPAGEIPDGVTAEVTFTLATSWAHRVSPAILTLTDGGVIGVKALDADNTVVFHPVDILENGLDGIWVDGLPKEVVLITVGQEFVTVGQEVTPIDEGTLQPMAAPGESS